MSEAALTFYRRDDAALVNGTANALSPAILWRAIFAQVLARHFLC